VTYHQAKELCAKANKRLPTNAEWYAFALGTPDNGSVCNIATDGLKTEGEEGKCVTPRGVHDAIGNAWEWVDDTVVNGEWRGRALPPSGYVVNADRDGVASITHEVTPNHDLHDDYFWSDTTGEFGMLRGGFYGSGSDAGLYSVQAKTVLSLSGAAIGFRCVSDVTS
jgi:formylglycine-generating enzyme required for sulfatase activity